MEDIFITGIEINKLRHLENIHIELSKNERKHLILTGKNGSGKTTLLEALGSYFTSVYQGGFQQLYKETQKAWDYFTGKKKHEIDGMPEVELSVFHNLLVSYHIKGNIFPKVNQYPNELFDRRRNNFIIAYFEAKRWIQFEESKGIRKIHLTATYHIDKPLRVLFLQYIVNLKFDRLVAKDEGKNIKAQEIDIWFDRFEKSLSDIFGENFVKLEFDSKNYTFNIIEKGKEKFDFFTLADGYSSIISIVSEIMIRMESSELKNYDIQGIVFIDEIEAHLHIELQKKVLPFLTAFFPKIQFIVSTHSPFVLSSIENAVVYDLEKKMQVEDLSGYSVDAIIESYFDSDKYSTVIKDKVARFELLLNQSQLNNDELGELDNLEAYIEKLPLSKEPELSYKFNQLKLTKYKKAS